MKPNQSSPSTSYSQHSPQAYIPNQLPFNYQFNINENPLLQYMNQEIIQLKINLYNQEIKHQQEINQLRSDMINKEKKNKFEINKMIKAVNKLQNNENMLKEELRIQNIKSEVRFEKRFKDVDKAILDLQKNYTSLNNEITNIKRNKSALNSILSVLDILLANLNAYNKEKNLKEIADLIGKIKNIESELREYLNEHNTIKEKFEIIFEKINELTKEIYVMNHKFNGEIKMLENQVKELEKKNKELQIIIISRKLVKIILKYFIKNCLKSFSLDKESNRINTLALKKEFYFFDQKKIMEILNELIIKNMNSNEIIHLEGFINDNLEIIKAYGEEIYLKNLIEILNIDEKKKDYLINIAKCYNIENTNVYTDIIHYDPDIKEMLNELELELKSKYSFV